MGKIFLKSILIIVVCLLMTATGILLKLESFWTDPLYQGSIHFHSTVSIPSIHELVLEIKARIEPGALGPHARVATSVELSGVVISVTSSTLNITNVVHRLESLAQKTQANITILREESQHTPHDTFLMSCIGEALKLTFSLVGHFAKQIYTREDVSESSKDLSGRKMTTSLIYSIPALLYVVDNNIYFVVISLIGPVKFHLYNSVKVVITALLVRVFLKQHITINQGCALLVLFVGLIITQQSEIFHQALDMCKAGHAEADYTTYLFFSSPTALLGFLLVICMAVCSSFANIWSEYVYKKDDHEGFYKKNIYLYAYGVLFNAVVVLVRGYIWQHTLRDYGLFTGFTSLTVVIILMQAAYGFLVAHVLKILDNIANVFAHAAALLLTVVLSAFLFSFYPTLLFFCGSTTIFCSMFLYHNTKDPQYASLGRSTNRTYEVEVVSSDESLHEAELIRDASL